MLSKPSRPKSERIRHRIKEIALQPLRSSKYPISVKLFVDDQEVCELPRVGKGQDLRWSRPIVCRDVLPESKVTLEICEIHTVVDRSFKSEAYTISDVKDQTERTVGFSGTPWTAKLMLLTPETVGQSHDNALQQLKGTELAPSGPDRLSKARKVVGGVLELGGAVAEAHPTAKLVFSICAVAWTRLKEEEKLREDTQELIDGLTGIVDLAKIVRDHTDMEQLKDTTEAALVLLEDIFIYVLERESKTGGSVARAARRLVDSSRRDKVKELLGRFERLKARFDREISVELLKRQYDQEVRQLIDELHPVQSADYNSKPACQDGTRVQIIQDVMSWTDQGPHATPSKRLLWIHGQAGIGKSSIASSVCRRLHQMGGLAASFFCKRRGGSELQDPLRLINTIAHGLASRCREYGEAVANSIKSDGNVYKTNSILERYEGLFDKPLKRIKEPALSRPLIVLVDALDECGTRETCDELPRCLHLLSCCVPWLKVVVTSRPDGDIREFFDKLGDEHFSTRNVHDFDASDDIRAYFEKELGNLAGRRRWEWPEGSVDRLCKKAGGLFIWASTARLHIGSPAAYEVAVQRFNVVLEGQKSAVSELDKLYEKVIEDGMRDTRDDNREVFCRYIGAIIVTSTRRPLSLESLCSLLLGQLDCETLEYVVESLRSVLHVDEQMGGALRFYHQSFVDYVTDQSRSSRFYVNPQERNTELARSCLNTMKLGLKFNICGLETSYLFNNQVPNLTERVQSKISSELSYSCVYWISHLTNIPNGVLQEDLDTLLGGLRVLYWLEALSLLGSLDLGMTGLLELMDWLPVNLVSTRESVMDLYRFTSTFFDAISASTPHLYVSALALAPESALIVRRLRSHFPDTISVTSGGDECWPTWLRTLTHPEKVWSFSISTDGRRLVTGCADGIIRLWDVRTGAQVGQPFVGHSEAVRSVALSPDGDIIASGSSDKTVRVWDVKNPSALDEPLVGHTGAVRSVAFSPNGDLVVSGSLDDTLRMWDTRTRASIGEPLVGHSGAVACVAFSPNGNRFVSGSNDKTLRIWDAKARIPVGDPLVGHSQSVISVAFSPNGNLIVSGSEDKTMRIWDAEALVPIGEPLVGHSHWVASAAFSPNGNQIVSGSFDKSVRIWDVRTHTTVAEPLLGHSGWVRSVAFSPKGDLIISASFDKTVRMWDAKASAATGDPFVGHSDWVTSVAFSPRGNLIASGSWDKTVRIWDVKACTSFEKPLVGHSDRVESVAFSPDGNLIVSGSSDNTLRMWDTRTCDFAGEPLVGHTSAVLCVAFSSDGDLIVSGSKDKTLRVWDVKGHTMIGGPLVGHSHFVFTVAFAPKGNLVASGSADKTARFWDARTHEPVGELPLEHPDAVECIAFSPDSERIVSSSNNALRTWDVQACTPIGEPLVGHSRVVLSVAFAPSGNVIASCSSDHTIRLWDVVTQAAIGEPLVGHSNRVTAIAFSPDGNLIVSGSGDHTVRLWRTELQASDYSAESHTSWPTTTFGLRPLKQHHGWVSLNNESLLLWLPIRYRRPYDPRALYSISTDPALSTISLDFSKFAHGTSWTSVAAD